MNSGLIMLAEDNAMQRKLYSDVLEARGFTVVTANNGFEALGLLQSMQPKVLVLDIMMPEMDGVEACRQVRKTLGAKLPIVFLTATDELDMLDVCMQAGGNDYLIKSSSIDHIMTRISYWARPTSVWNSKARLEQAMTAVKKAVVEKDLAKHGQSGELTARTDDTVRRMSAFVTAALALASKDFGKTVDQKLYLLGYVTGMVDHWTQIKRSMRARYLDYLKSVLWETKILGAGEIQKMMDTYEELIDQDIFQLACERGRRESDEAADRQDDFVPKGLADFEGAIAV